MRVRIMNWMLALGGFLALTAVADPAAAQCCHAPAAAVLRAASAARLRRLRAANCRRPRPAAAATAT